MIELIKEILNEIEEKYKSVRLSGGRGYSSGKIYKAGSDTVQSKLGKYEEPKEKEYKIKPVKISKAFKKEK